MFTGIITHIGTVIARDDRGDVRLRIAAPHMAMDKVAMGASIACSGCCLTVVDKGGTGEDSWFAVDISAETRRRTASGLWETGAKLNLEPALKLGDELGGHLVTGHVDGLASVISIDREGNSLALVLAVDASLGRMIASKGP